MAKQDDGRPEELDEVPAPAQIGERLGFWPAAISLAAFATAMLLAWRAASGSAGAPVAAGLALVGAGLALVEIRRRRRRATLVLGDGTLAVYRRGKRAATWELGLISQQGLDVGTTLQALLVPAALAGVGFMLVVVIGDEEPTTRLACAVWSVALTFGVASNVYTRLLSLVFLIPDGDRRRRVRVGRAGGARILGAMPRVGGWRVPE